MNSESKEKSLGEKKISNHERFVKIAERRTQTIISQLDLLGNCSNKYNYEYSRQEVDKMFNAIDSALKECKSKFSNSSIKNSVFKF